MILLLQSPVTISWLTVQSSTLRQTVVDKLGKENEEVAKELLPFSNNVIDASYILEVITELIDHALDHDVVVAIASSALKNTSSFNDNMLKYLTIFSTILEPVNDLSIHTVVSCLARITKCTLAPRQ